MSLVMFVTTILTKTPGKSLIKRWVEKHKATEQQLYISSHLKKNKNGVSKIKVRTHTKTNPAF